MPIRRRHRSGPSRFRGARAAASRACSRPTCRTPFELVLVNDATPEPELARYLRELREKRPRDADRAAVAAGLSPQRSTARSRCIATATWWSCSPTPKSPTIGSTGSRTTRRRAGVGVVGTFTNNAGVGDVSAAAQRQSAAGGHTVATLDALFARANRGAVGGAARRRRALSLFPPRLPRRGRRVRRRAAGQRLRRRSRFLPARRQRGLSPPACRRRVRRPRRPRVVRRARGGRAGGPHRARAVRSSIPPTPTQKTEALRARARPAVRAARRPAAPGRPAAQRRSCSFRIRGAAASAAT